MRFWRERSNAVASSLGSDPATWTFQRKHVHTSVGYRTRMEFDTISTSKKTIDSRYVRFRYLPYTSKLSLSIIISIRNTGMPGDGGRNAFDVSIHCEHFRENIVILVLDIEREWSSIWCRYFDTLWTFQRKHVHTSVGYRTRMEFDAISISKKTINTCLLYTSPSPRD